MKSTHKLYMQKSTRRAILANKNNLFKSEASKMDRKIVKTRQRSMRLKISHFNLRLKIA